jgi:ribonuclease-3
MLNQLLATLKIKTKNIKIYEEALTHKSFANESRLDYSYQKLEFLGDAIINYLVSKFLYAKNLENEAEMTKWKINLVQTKSLARACREINLDKLIRLGNSETIDNISTKILDDVFEAFCAAVYLDSGESKVVDILNLTLFKYYNEGESVFEKDYKSILQERLQAITKKTIEYKIIGDLDQTLVTVGVYSDKKLYGQGTAETKKQAAINAAKNALEKL